MDIKILLFAVQEAVSDLKPSVVPPPPPSTKQIRCREWGNGGG